MPDASFVRLSDQFADWRNDLFSGERPTLYPVAGQDSPLAKLELGPGRIWVVGGAPAAGKTALVMQLVVDAVRLTESLKVLILNVEMSVESLLDRQLARFSGVPLTTIRERQFTEDIQERVAVGLDTIQDIADRLTFCLPPYTLGNVIASADAVDADLIVLDYVQRIQPAGDLTTAPDRRGQIDAVMHDCRRIADAGRAVIVVSSLSRQRNSGGSANYDTAGLASFRESSELEYGADDCFILQDDGQGRRKLKHLKARHSEPRDRILQFDGSLQRFEPVNPLDSDSGGSPDDWSDVSELWGTDDAEDAP